MAEQRSRKARAGGAQGQRSRKEPEHTAPDSETPPETRPICPVGFCPVGMALTFGEQVRPEVVEHVLAAGRELLLAMKAVVDARVEAFERSSPLERITIE